MDEAVKTTKGKLLMMVIVLATMLVALAATSKPAEAYTQRTYGQPGGATGYLMNGSHYNACQHTSVGGVCWTPWVYGDGPTISRSPATWGDQNVAAIYFLQRWNGSSWEIAARSTHHRTIPAGVSRIQLPKYNIMKAHIGYYRVHIAISWNSAYGQQLGQRHLIYQNSGDYACRTSVRPCSTGAGWVYLG